MALISLSTVIAKTRLIAENDFIAAVALNKPTLEYPRSMSSHGIPGYVRLVYMIGKDGKPFEISVEYSSNSAFEKNAINTLENTIFQPATYKGEPVDSKSHHTMRFSVRGAYKRLNRKSNALITNINKLFEKSNPDQETIRKWLDKLQASADQFPKKKADLWDLELRYAKLFGTPSDEVEALRELLTSLRFHASANKEAPKIFMKLFNKLIEQGRYAESLSAWEQFKGRYFLSSQPESLTKKVDELRGVIASGKGFSRSIKIPESGKLIIWPETNNFYFETSNGDIDRIKFRCETAYFEKDYNKSDTFSLPTRLGRCVIELIGAPATQANFVRWQ
jgi:TonB family protein